MLAPRLSAEFQWFFIVLSVRPGRYLASSDLGRATARVRVRVRVAVRVRVRVGVVVVVVVRVRVRVRVRLGELRPFVPPELAVQLDQRTLLVRVSVRVRVRLVWG